MNHRFRFIHAAQGNAKPELPEEGFERKIEWTPAYDKRSEGFGIHGMEMRAILLGPDGAISFTLFTNWQMPT